MEITTALVGNNFRPLTAQVALSQLQIGDTIRLEREPDNAYDENAIKCMVDNEHVGFVAKTEAAVLAPVIDSSPNPAIARISGWINKKKPELRIVIEP